MEKRSGFGYSLFYRLCWLAVSILGAGWGLVVGLSLAGGGFLGPATIASGSIVLLGLMVTLLVAGRR